MNTTLPILSVLAAAALLSGCAGATGPASSSPSPAPAQAPAPAETSAPRLVQPGAPGQATRVVTQSQLQEMGGVAYVQADVDFMQGMIPHHAQALQMTSLVGARTRDAGIVALALRMEISQRDEIAMMERWLRDRDEDVPAWSGSPPSQDRGGMDHAAMGHESHGGGHLMPGMLTPEQMSQLQSAAGVEFDRLFLEFMIQHHQGAIVMVDALFATDGAGQESEIFQFASHVDADQRAEIARMRGLLDALR